MELATTPACLQSTNLFPSHMQTLTLFLAYLLLHISSSYTSGDHTVILGFPQVINLEQCCIARDDAMDGI
jgi:hypothetical protein